MVEEREFQRLIEPTANKFERRRNERRINWGPSVLPKLLLRVRKVLRKPAGKPPLHDGEATAKAWQHMLAVSYREAAARETRLAELAATLDSLGSKRH